MPIDVAAIEAKAKQELEEEQFRVLVEERKAILRKRKWWHRLLPYTITIHRRD